MLPLWLLCTPPPLLLWRGCILVLLCGWALLGLGPAVAGLVCSSWSVFRNKFGIGGLANPGVSELGVL